MRTSGQRNSINMCFSSVPSHSVALNDGSSKVTMVQTLCISTRIYWNEATSVAASMNELDRKTLKVNFSPFSCSHLSRRNWNKSFWGKVEVLVFIMFTIEQTLSKTHWIVLFYNKMNRAIHHIMDGKVGPMVMLQTKLQFLHQLMKRIQSFKFYFLLMQTITSIILVLLLFATPPPCWLSFLVFVIK